MDVVSLVPLSDADRSRIEAVDSSITLTMAPGWFDGELRETWGERTAGLYLRADSNGIESRAERDRLLASAEAILVGFPVPIDLRARSPRLRWVHQTPAGASNLRRCDIWDNDVLVTTSRGLGSTEAIAEYVVASFLYFARSLHIADDDRRQGSLDRGRYRPILLKDKTVCVVGAGGIGREVGLRCAALGMRVVGTRSSAGGDLFEGFDEIGGPDRLLEYLAEARFVAVCCQSTPETEGLIGDAALDAVPDDAVIVNIARGEVIDEEALGSRLDRLRGVALDVYVGEFDRQPPAELWPHPKVLVTPHTSGGAEHRSGRPVDLFCRNLAALVAERPLENMIDWDRGY